MGEEGSKGREWGFDYVREGEREWRKGTSEEGTEIGMDGSRERAEKGGFNGARERYREEHGREERGETSRDVP